MEIITLSGPVVQVFKSNGSKLVTSEQKNIHGVTLFPRFSHAPSLQVWCFPVSFKFQYSIDGKSWVDVPGHSYVNYPKPVDDNPITSALGSPVKAQHIGILITEFDQGNGGYAQLAQFSVVY